MAQNNNNSNTKKTKPAPKKKANSPNFEKILSYDRNLGLFIPIKWKYPYLFKKKDYIAHIIGMNPRYEFERAFLEKTEFEIDDDESKFGIGYDPKSFKDGQIIEEKFSYKEKKTFITNINYWKIIILDDEVLGEKISKTQIKDVLTKKQELIYERIREIMDEFGDNFTLLTMQSILKQKQALSKRDINFFFLT